MKSFSEFQPRPGEHQDLFYHSSPSEISSFHPLSHFGTANAARARAYARKRFSFFGRKAKHNYTVRLNLGNTVDLKHDAGVHDPGTLLWQLHKDNHLGLSKQEFEQHKRKLEFSSKQKGAEHLVGLMKSKGIDSLSYPNSDEDPGKKSYIITDSSQVRILHKGRKLNLKRGELFHKTGSSVNHYGEIG